MRIDTTTIPANAWRTAVKTKNILAKPISSIVSDIAFLGKLLINTIEGKEPVTSSAVICVGGEEGEAWQQTAKKLLDKYTIVDITADGWLVCQPKPDNETFAYMAPGHVTDEFSIIGLWGETLADGTKNVQRGKGGDFIMQSKTDPNDRWIVKRSLFKGTYNIKD